MSSIFTRIINREIPSSIIYEDDICIAILDINPVQKWHTLVIPKQELEWMDQYDDSTVWHCMIVASKLMRNMKTVMSDIHFVYLAVEGIEVPHWHIHLIPYVHGSVYPHVHRIAYDTGEQQQYLDLLQTNLSD
jgi:histidine triad (HIT) family protein